MSDSNQRVRPTGGRSGGARFDVAIVGAGAAGLYCAWLAGARGARVVLIDHAPNLAEKIRISGGGRCNFTNLSAGDAARYVGEDPRFARFALAEHGPDAFLERVRAHRIRYHEKHRGQLFCDDSAERIIDMLAAGCDAAGVAWRRPVAVRTVDRDGEAFRLGTDAGTIETTRLVVATGGLPVPRIGATDWGLRLARRFGLDVVEPRAALVPLTFAPEAWAPFVPLAGLSLEVGIEAEPGTADAPSVDGVCVPGLPATPAPADPGMAAAPRPRPRRGVRPVHFVEDLLFTHRGLSGPAVLQASSFWRPGDALRVDLAPGVDLAAELLAAKSGGRRSLSNVLAERLPRRLAHDWLAVTAGAEGERRIADLPDRALRDVAAALGGWRLRPTGTEGWRKAEVMRGGVSTRELDPRTLESRRVPGLHFIGEVVDVTGWLGGYNFQWAWSSAAACAHAMTATH